MLHLLRLAFAIIAVLYIGLCLLLFFFQRSFIYFPKPNSQRDRATVITLPGPAARVLVSTRPQESLRALLYFGGNAEDVSFNMPSLSSGFLDTAIYLMHYRGYGGSSGKPSEKALFSDALALFDLAHGKHSEIEVIGRSLGSGIAVFVASQRPVKRLVLVTPFDSLSEVAAAHFPYVPVRWLLLDKFESGRYAPNVTAPTVIIAADHDEVVPRVSTERLLARFQSGLASMYTLDGTDHNSISANARYLHLLKGWQ